MIQAEGVDTLTFFELISACQNRGIRTIDFPEDRLRYELQQWLDLRTKHDIPPTLLVLSRALMMTDRPLQSLDTAAALQSTLAALPNEAVSVSCRHC
jgi:LETM1 and EF-hand domain-containing protein 1